MSAEFHKQPSHELESLDRRLGIIKNSLVSLVTEVSASNLDITPQFYIFGSFGRRVAISGAKDWNDYRQSVIGNPRLFPRKSSRNLWDVDIAVPTESVPWPILASVSRKISRGNSQVEIDPHYIDIDAKSMAFSHGNTLISSNNFKFEIRTFDFTINDGLAPIKIPDMWSQLLFYLSSKRIRPRDIPEIAMLADGLLREDGFSDKSRVAEAIRIAKNNKKLFSLKNIARWPYWVAVPYPLRVKVAKLRHVQNADIRGYDRPDPVHF